MTQMKSTRRSWRNRGARALTAVTLAGGLLVVAPATASAAETSYQVTVSDPSVSVGDTVEITVAADDVDDLYAYSFELGYDPELLAYVDESATTEISGSTTAKVSEGSVELIHTKLGTSPAATGDVELVTATFEALADGSATVTASDLTSVTSESVRSTTPELGSATTVIGKKSGPVPTVVPSIAGTARVGYVQTVDTGEWNVDSLDFTFQWLSGGLPVPGAEGTTFRARPGDAGKKLTIVITASAPGYSPTTLAASSSAIGKAVTRTSLKSSKRTFKAGKALKTTVKVTAPGTAPTGTLTYRYRGKNVRTGVKLVGGKASVTFRPKAKGYFTLSATFVPAAGFSSSRASIRIHVK